MDGDLFGYIRGQRVTATKLFLDYPKQFLWTKTNLYIGLEDSDSFFFSSNEQAFTSPHTLKTQRKKKIAVQKTTKKDK